MQNPHTSAPRQIRGVAEAEVVAVVAAESQHPEVAGLHLGGADQHRGVAGDDQPLGEADPLQAVDTLPLKAVDG